MNRFQYSQDSAAQEQRRRIRDENRKNERQRKIATRRRIIVGGIVEKNLPAVMNLQPGLKQVDTDMEFAGLDEFFSIVAGDHRFSALFRELISEERLGGNSQQQ